MRKALVTGSAGFIGFHLCRRLLADGFEVIGFDALTDYYDVRLKERRQAQLLQSPGFRTVTARLEEEGRLAALLAAESPEIVVHLAAQAGVRHSIDAPRSYVDANLIGTFNLLEAVRAQQATARPCRHLLIASTSSVYGANAAMPYAETHKADSPMSFYAATKKANEAMAHAYAHLYDMPTTMFRFFTVYGPWGRPDMALFRFTRAILQGEPIDVYNHGDMLRDFTHVDDLVEGIRLLIDTVPPRPAGAAPVAPAGPGAASALGPDEVVSPAAVGGPVAPVALGGPAKAPAAGDPGAPNPGRARGVPAAQDDQGATVSQGDRGATLSQGDRGATLSQGNHTATVTAGDQGATVSQGDPGAAAPPGSGAAPAAAGDTLSPVAPYRIVNIGNGRPSRLLDFIEAIEEAAGRKAVRRMHPMQPGDVPATWADGTLLRDLTGYVPKVALRDGVRGFVEWYREHYGV